MHSITSLSDQGMKQFKIVVIERLISNIVQAILRQIQKDRNGQIMDVDPNLL